MRQPEALDDERARFMALAAALAVASDRDEQARLKEELARRTFGKPRPGRPEPKPAGRV